jgi:hydroxyacylglutathione hydrolase
LKEKVKIQQIKVGQYRNFSYLVYDPQAKVAVIFDPAFGIAGLIKALKEEHLELRYVINTHAHFDHVEGNAALAEASSAKIIMSEKSYAKKDIGAADGQILKVTNDLVLRFVHTPGHSPESMCIVINDFALITGDTLFIGECGRTDLPGGSAEDLYESFTKLRKLNPKLIVYPGHDYGKVPSATLADELESNYTLSTRTKEEFVKFMGEP